MFWEARTGGSVGIAIGSGRSPSRPTARASKTNICVILLGEPSLNADASGQPSGEKVT